MSAMTSANRVSPPSRMARFARGTASAVALVAVGFARATRFFGEVFVVMRERPHSGGRRDFASRGLTICHFGNIAG